VITAATSGGLPTVVEGLLADPLSRGVLALVAAAVVISIAGWRIGLVGCVLAGVLWSAPLLASAEVIEHRLRGTTPVATAVPCGDVAGILQTIRTVESGGDYGAQAAGSTASGAYQFIDTTWQGLGGTGRAADAPPAEQDARAAVGVERILAEHNGQIDLVPVVWYFGSLPVGAEWDTIPRPDAGNVLTPREYQARWVGVAESLPGSAWECAAPSVSGGGTEPALVPIGQGHELTAEAAAGYRAWEARYGQPIPLTGSYRSHAEQADCHRRKPTLCLDPAKSTSWHMRGLAVDVHTGYLTPALVAAAEATGWCQSALSKGEPWHFSYGGCG
jgi:hypothetical protein